MRRLSTPSGCTLTPGGRHDTHPTSYPTLRAIIGAARTGPVQGGALFEISRRPVPDRPGPRRQPEEMVRGHAPPSAIINR
jgi:hypothetical protein